jgi:hypothetical protein
VRAPPTSGTTRETGPPTLRVRFVQDTATASEYSGYMSENDLRTLPHVGPAVARMLTRLGVEQPHDLADRDPEQLFRRLCEIDGRRHDPCLLDTFTAIVDHANGAPARAWWFYSRQRKARDTNGRAIRPEPVSP